MNIGYLLQTLNVSTGRLAANTVETLRKRLERYHKTQITRSTNEAKRQADAGQLALFGGDALDVRFEIEVGNAVQDSVSAALAAKQAQEMGAIEPGDATSAMDPAIRKALDLAVVMRSTGADLKETEEALKAAYTGKQIAVVMREVQDMERMQGAMSASGIGDAPATRKPKAGAKKSAAPSADDDFDLHEADDDADEGLEADAEGAESHEVLESASLDAFTALMAQLRSERYQPMTVERERELGLRIKAGDHEARQEMVERNMRFLIYFARSFVYTGKPLDFLVAAGAVGLITAASKFDPEKGRFTTVANHWIRSEIQQACRRDNVIRTPSGATTRAKRARQEADAAETDEERQTWEARERYALDAVSHTRNGAVSLNAPVGGGEDGDASLADLLAAEGPGMEEQMESRQLIRQMVKAANDIESPLRQSVFKMRTGLDESAFGEPMTYSEIGERLGMSAQAIQQHYIQAAQEVCGSMVSWAKGPQNLPPQFCAKLMRPGMIH
ncbi:MAG: sigma-70 family RNA polymerase sigma factor [Polaromonas sp.]|nr:sigma-70 family RNA polymerase sigma factor [Polaromonas sp.]